VAEDCGRELRHVGEMSDDAGEDAFGGKKK
jgi:hypothetical protein